MSTRTKDIESRWSPESIIPLGKEFEWVTHACRDIPVLIDQLKEKDAMLEKAREALIVMAKHFGPLEDNHMLSPECRNTFKTAREALAALRKETE